MVPGIFYKTASAFQVAFLTFYLFLCFKCLRKCWILFIQWRREQSNIFFQFWADYLLLLGLELVPMKLHSHCHYLEFWSKALVRVNLILLNRTFNFYYPLGGLFLRGFTFFPVPHIASTFCLLPLFIPLFIQQIPTEHVLCWR